MQEVLLSARVEMMQLPRTGVDQQVMPGLYYQARETAQRWFGRSEFRRFSSFFHQFSCFFFNECSKIFIVLSGIFHDFPTFPCDFSRGLFERGPSTLGALPARAPALRGRRAEPPGPLHAEQVLCRGAGLRGELHVRRAAQAHGLGPA